MAKSAGQLKFGSVGPFSLMYENDAHKDVIFQICNLMVGAQNLISQKRLDEAVASLNQAESLHASLTRDAGYRSCCEATNNGRWNSVKAEADRQLKMAQQQKAQDDKNAAFSQGVQSMAAGTQARLDAIRSQSQSYSMPSMAMQPATGQPNLMLILGIGGGVITLLLLIILLSR